jgi:hypothetical protein
MRRFKTSSAFLKRCYLQMLCFLILSPWLIQTFLSRSDINKARALCPEEWLINQIKLKSFNRSSMLWRSSEPWSMAAVTSLKTSTLNPLSIQWLAFSRAKLRISRSSWLVSKPWLPWEKRTRGWPCLHSKAGVSPHTNLTLSNNWQPSMIRPYQGSSHRRQYLRLQSSHSIRRHHNIQWKVKPRRLALVFSRIRAIFWLYCKLGASS